MRTRLKEVDRALQKGQIKYVLEDIAMEMAEYHYKIKPLPHAYTMVRLRALLRHVIKDEEQRYHWMEGFRKEYGFEW